MMRLFIADGSSRLRQQLSSLLGQLAGLEIVGQADTAPEALSAIAELRPDVVILDIHLSGGIDMLKQIKQATPPPIVITLTMDDYPQYRRSCLAAGADYLLNKPSDLKKLTAIIDVLNQPPRPPHPETHHSPH